MKIPHTKRLSSCAEFFYGHFTNGEWFMEETKKKSFSFALEQEKWGQRTTGSVHQVTRAHCVSFEGSRTSYRHFSLLLKWQRREWISRASHKECVRKAFFTYRHFERKREIFFVRGQSRKVRKAENGKHRTPSEWGSWCFSRIPQREWAYAPSAASFRRKEGVENTPSPYPSLLCEKNPIKPIYSFTKRKSNVINGFNIADRSTSR